MQIGWTIISLYSKIYLFIFWLAYFVEFYLSALLCNEANSNTRVFKIKQKKKRTWGRNNNTWVSSRTRFAQRFKKKKKGSPLPELVEMLTGVVARVVSDGSKSPVHFERQSLTNWAE